MEAWSLRNGYDAKLDYVSSHLKWIGDHKNFLPKNSSWYMKYGYTYFEIMKELYTVQTGKYEHLNMYAFGNYIMDKMYWNETFVVEQNINRAVSKLKPTPNGLWFVTIGFNHDTWNVADCCKCIEKVLAMDWIISAKANFELFRQNGEHPHCHFVIETKEPKSKILEKIYRPLYTKKVVFSKNFIDVKPMMKYHKDYIMLIKQSEKMELVEKDIQWRLSAGIPDYEKNFDLAKFDV